MIIAVVCISDDTSLSLLTPIPDPPQKNSPLL